MRAAYGWRLSWGGHRTLTYVGNWAVTAAETKGMKLLASPMQGSK